MHHYLTLGANEMLVQLYKRLSRRKIHQAQFRRTAKQSPDKKAESSGNSPTSKNVNTVETEEKQEEEEDDAENGEFQESYMLSQMEVDKDIKMEVVKSEQVSSIFIVY
ncbi:hypothetical protein PR048_022897 [Dryococelus australis]|uniref:Uncharacterized protein n=1 Tax=Dryococelus australis TaxID=614101 RepID=A0ABQ9GSL2_9NEOP|nr:hypothetical protein PR048_022897 [Dryococelus australis]